MQLNQDVKSKRASLLLNLQPIEEDEDHHSSEDFDGPSKTLTHGNQTQLIKLGEANKQDNIGHAESGQKPTMPLGESEI